MVATLPSSSSPPPPPSADDPSKDPRLDRSAVTRTRAPSDASPTEQQPVVSLDVTADPSVETFARLLELLPETRGVNRVFELDWDLVALFQDASLWDYNRSSPTEDSFIAKDTLETLNKKLRQVCEPAKDWAKPQSNLLQRGERDGGWLLIVLKLHQIVAQLTAQEGAPLMDTMSLWAAVQKASDASEDEGYHTGYGDGVYQDYHPEEPHTSTDSTTSTKTTSNANFPDKQLAATTQPVGHEITPNRINETDSLLDTRYPPLYVALAQGVWELVSQEESSSSSSSSSLSDFCVHDDSKTLLVVDANHLIMAVTSGGRFDAYLLALIASALENVKSIYEVHPSALLAGSWDMARNRAAHGLRVLKDATVTYRLTQAKYEWYVTLLTSGSLRAVQDTFHDLANEIWHAQFSRGDSESAKRLETLLVALLGHRNDMVRSQAAVFLNNFYDQHDWQQNVPFLPVVKCVGDAFTVEITISDSADFRKGESPKGVFLILSAPSFHKQSAFETYTYHELQWEPAAADRSKARIFQTRRDAGSHSWTGVCRFGEFPRCGYYDWRVVRCEADAGSWSVVQSTIGELSDHFEGSYSFVHLGESEDGEHDGDHFSFRRRNLWPELARLADIRERLDVNQEDASPFRTLPLQGRFILQPKAMRQEQFHEIFVDQHGARVGADEKGSFAKVGAAVSNFKEDGVTALYLSGCLSRDTGEVRYTPNGDQIFERPEASPYAVTCRATPCNILGGVRGFSDMMKQVDRHGMKVIVDSLSRVSSSRSHRKYWPHILYSIDDQGKRMMLYGSDGRSMAFEESCMLNYRQVEAWDLMVSDIIAWQTRMGVHGVKLDNAHLIPQIMQVDEEELSRNDPDGRPHYAPEERLRGDIVLPCSDDRCGFWSSTAANSHWPNPMVVRICRDLWRVAPEFMLVGDCAIMEAGQEKRVGSLARSGVVPQMHSLPNTLCGLFGKRIEACGTVKDTERCPAVALTSWFEATHESLPEGAITIQSSCSQSSPLPGLLYGRGAWPATDLLFFSSDIPATSMGEIEGHTFRLGVANVFKAETTINVENGAHVSHRQMSAAKSLLNIEDATARSTPTPMTPRSPVGGAGAGGMCSRARSLTKFEPIAALDTLEEEQAKTIGPEFGFDIKKIPAHYKHRRSIRKAFDIFSKGVLFPLKAVDATGQTVPGVFCFSRFDLSSCNLLIGAINFAEVAVPELFISVRFLSKHLHSRGVASSSIIEKWSLFECDNTFNPSDSGTVNAVRTGDLSSLSAGKMCLMTLAEALADPHRMALQPYSSSCIGIKLLKGAIEEAQETTMALFVSSLTRFERLVGLAVQQRQTHGAVAAVVERAMRANYVGTSLVNAINIPGDLLSLTEVLRNVSRAVQWRCEVASVATETPATAKAENFSLFQLLVDSGLLNAAVSDHGDDAVKLFAKLERILEASPPTADLVNHPQADLYQICKEIKEGNSLGPVVFMTVELGKWSVVGGLGVMVDELSLTMANDLGQEAWVISPYYHKNRKGEVDYLKRDGIEWKFNVTVTVGGQGVVLGVHEGMVKGVRVIFIHNEHFFPYPYPDCQAADAVKFLAVIGKSFLEILCHKQTIPQIIITNDWATGLIPAYAKHGHFGETFKQTTFFHIIHNFDPAYEGRVYPPPKEDFAWIHGLPRDLLVDPLWAEVIVNPSRCALMCCDTWGTVSRSYRDELRNSSGSAPSPLAYLLNRFPTPFATPNGIPIAMRKARLNALPTKTHEEAKGLLQKKYFGFEKPDPTIPLFAFIGRITSQKGVHLILEAAESVIKRYNYRVQILVGGKVGWNDPYSARCGNHMYSLRDRYPWSFWADPNEFFSDGTLVNIGADFGLMPSLFEPGGIVQHEFFVAGTPVLAFKTGGLKDTVFEFDLENVTGNGFTFASYNLGDFIFAFERANRVFQDPAKYTKLRQNSEASVVSCETCATAWMGEFCRLRRKILVNPNKIGQEKSSLPKWDPSVDIPRDTEPVRAMVQRMAAERNARRRATEAVTRTALDMGGNPSETLRRPTRIKFVPVQGRRPRSVAISGSFDDWRVRRPLAWDNAQQAYIATLALPVGKYVFKFIVDGDWICAEDHPSEIDAEGIKNNILNVV